MAGRAAIEGGVAGRVEQSRVAGRADQQRVAIFGDNDRDTSGCRLCVAVSAGPWIAQPVPAEITGAGGKAQSRL